MGARRLLLLLLVSVCGSMSGFVFGVADAGALQTHELIGEFQAGSDPNGVAVDESTGEVYVAERAINVVDRFNASGNPVSFAATGGHALSGAATPAGSFAFPAGEPTPAGLAVDNDALSASYRDLYVLDAGHGVIDKFDSTGAYVGQLSGTPGGPFAGLEGVAVDTAGNVWVYEASGRVDQFDAAGVFKEQFATGCESPEPGPGFAVDSSDDVYTRCGVSVHKWGPGGVDLGELAIGLAFAVDQADGHVFVEHETEIREFDASGAPVTIFEYPHGGREGGVAVDGATGDVYVSSHTAGNVAHFGPLLTLPDVVTEAASGVQQAAAMLNGSVNPNGVQVTVCRFEYGISGFYGQSVPCAQEPGSGAGSVPVNASLGGLAADTLYHFRVVAGNANGVLNYGGDETFTTTGSPSVDEESAGELQQTAAALSAQVNPHGFDTTYHFEYGTSTAYGTSVPVPDVDIGEGTSDVPVGAELTGLQAGTTYHFRVVAGSSAGTTRGRDETFTTVAPALIDSFTITNITSNGASVSARVNPLGNDTTYHLEYGTSTAYGASIPVPDDDLGAGNGDQTASQQLSGLTPDTTYHVRIVLQNALGVVHGSDHTFVYSTSGGGLPDNRAYEMVTPPHKNGALIDNAPFSLAPQVSEDGLRVFSASIQCFADAVSCVGARLDYLGSSFEFVRSGGGWMTVPLAPAAKQFPLNVTWTYSADAGRTLFSAPTPPAGEEDLYAREPDGSISHIGPLTPPALGMQGPGAGSLAVTPDLSHIVWATNAGAHYWPFDATETGRETIYEYSGTGNSQPALVDVSGGPGSTSLISACGTQLGDAPGVVGVPGVLSADGGTVFLTAIGQDFSGCGSGAAAPPSNELYARVGESRTVLISGRPASECTGVCLGSPPGDAFFAGASQDGSKVFFESTQQLTDSASEDSHSGDSASYQRGCHVTVGANGCNLYLYDFANPAGRELIGVSAGDTSGGGPRVQGVMALSPDGSHVYFVAKGVLSGAVNAEGQGARDGANNLYVYERDASFPAGRLAFIAALPAFDQPEWAVAAGNPANVTPNGRFLVFTSSGRLTADDTSSSGARQVFRYDAQTGSLVRLSSGEDGFNDNGNRSTPAPCNGSGCAEDATIVAVARYYERRADPTMSNDGSFVFFRSPVGLTPRALDDVQIGTDNSEGRPVYAQNVYEWHEGHVHLISDGRDVQVNPGNGDGFCEGGQSSLAAYSSVCLLGTDATGSNVFFTTADPLVPQDVNSGVDYYDARVCSPDDPCVSASAASPGCDGEACHGIPPAAPSLLTGGTVAFSGPGNLAPAAARVFKPKARHKAKPRKRTKRRGGKHRTRRAGQRHGHVNARGKK